MPWSEFFPGLHQAVLDALAKHGVSAGLIMCFLRHLGPEAAAETLEQVRQLGMMVIAMLTASCGTWGLRQQQRRWSRYCNWGAAAGA